MTDYASELLSTPYNPQRGNFQDDYVGDLLKAGTTRPNEPVVQDQGAGLVTNFLANLPRDPETRIQVYADRMFPNQTNARERFGIKDGQIVYRDDDGALVDVESGKSSMLGRWLSNAPEVAGGVIGSFATGNPFSGAVIGEVGGSAAKRAISGLVFDEPLTPRSVGSEMAVTGAGATIGGLTGKGLTSLYNRSRVPGADAFDLRQANQTIDRVRDTTGVNLDYAQAADMRFLRNAKKWVQKYPGESQEIIDALDAAQQGQFSQAVERLMGSLTRTSDPEAMASAGVNAATLALRQAQSNATNAAQPLYERAYGSGMQVDPSPVIRSIQGLLGRAKGDERTQLKRALNFMYRRSDDGQMVPDTSLEGLHGARMALDDWLERPASRETSLSNRIKSELTTVRNQLNGLLKQSPEFAEADQVYSKYVRDVVEPLKNSSVGALARVSDTPARTRAVNKVLTDGFENPAAVRAMRTALSGVDGGEQAWRDVLALKIQKAWNKSLRENADATVPNPFGKWRKTLYGTPDQVRAWSAALPQDSMRSFVDLMDAAALLARDFGQRGGSDTAFNEAIGQQMGRGAVGAAANVITKPVTWLSDLFDQRAVQANAKAFAEALTDPAKVKRLRELRALPKGSERATAMLSVVMGAGGGETLLTSPARDIEPRVIQ